MAVEVEGFGLNGTVVTLNAVPTSIIKLEISPNRSGWLVSRIITRRASDGVAKVWEFGLGFKRDVGNVVVFGVNLTSTKGVASDQAVLNQTDVSIIANVNEVEVLVTGLATTELDWAGTLSGEAVVHV